MAWAVRLRRPDSRGVARLVQQAKELGKARNFKEAIATVERASAIYEVVQGPMAETVAMLNSCAADSATKRRVQLCGGRFHARNQDPREQASASSSRQHATGSAERSPR